jgi:hypothetical protein
VDLSNGVRGVDQQPRRPQRVGQVVAAAFEFGGEAAVEQDRVTACEQ